MKVECRVADRLTELLDREILGSPQRNQLMPALADFSRRCRNSIRNFEWDRLDSVAVAVNQITRLHLKAADLQLASEIENVRVGV